MGRRGPLPRQNGRKVQRGAILPLRTITGGALKKPEMPREWLPLVVGWWDAFWRSDLLDVATEVDMPKIIRLFDAYDQYERLMAQVRADPLVEHRGETRNHPAEMPAMRQAKLINELESEIGIGATSRKRLQIATGRAAMTAVEFNRMHRENGGDNSKSRIIDAEFEAL